jgi:hypothetical protein
MVEELVEELVDAAHPDVHRLTGTANLDDPAQAVRRLVAARRIPFIRITPRRIRFSIPALQKWANEQINNSIAARAATK